MKAYSVDLRERIVAAVKNGQSHRAVARRFNVAKATVTRLVHQFAQYQNLAPGKARGKPPRLTEAHWADIEAFLANNPNMTVPDLQTWMRDTLGVSLSVSAVHDNLKRHGYTFKKRAWSLAREMNPTERSSENTSPR
jgi:transposase